MISQRYLTPLGLCLWPDSGLHFWLSASSVYLLCIVDLSISYSLLSLSLAHNSHQNHCNKVSDQANVTRGHKACPGVPLIMVYREGSARKEFLFTALGMWKYWNFPCSRIRKGRKMCHFPIGLSKGPKLKGLTDVIYGCVKVEKTLWFVIYSYLTLSLPKISTKFSNFIF